MNKSFNNGYTLTEMIVIVAILVILAVIAIPMVGGYVTKANQATDQANLSTLNRVTTFYQLDEQHPDGDLFDGLTSDDQRMLALVDHGYLDKKLTPAQKDKEFVWEDEHQEWDITDVEQYTVLDGIIMAIGGHKGYIKGSYTGDDKTLSLPLALDGIDITNVYQDVFNNKGLTSVEFDPATKVTHIHARAFSNNKITEVTLPSTLMYLDYGAFNNNPITKITIGSGVIMQTNVFNNNNSFRDAYNIQGAGTYILLEGKWVKQ